MEAPGRPFRFAFDSTPPLSPPPAAAPSLAPGPVRGGPTTGFARGGEVAWQVVRDAEDLIWARPDAPVRARELARRVGVSSRSLFRAFQHVRGHGPLKALTRARLHHVRRDLLTAEPSARVGDIAASWGFSHLGRFAAAYRRLFGEHPSATLRAARRLSPAQP
jgi:transcriptional regulator GlxA family with amidase domain